jgi:hypothetical protein
LRIEVEQTQQKSRLLLHEKNGKSNILILYVDDLLIIENYSLKITPIKKQLKQRFEITNLDRVKKYFGLACVFRKHTHPTHSR